MPWPFAWTDERKELVRDLWAAGYTARDIAHQVGGVSRNAVIGVIHRNKFPIGQRRAKPMPSPEPLPPAYFVREEKPEPPPLPPPSPPTPGFLGLPLGLLSESQCRWPHGDGPFTFCGQAQERGSPYCPDHKARAHSGHSR